MIKLLKNKEVRKALLWQLLLSAAACAVCFFFDIRAGLTAAGLSLLLMLVFCISTYKRYQRISSLADDINQVLHGDSSIDFDSYSEGELSILHSEIYKMTIRLREQQQTLTREKAHLADSIADISHQIRTPLTSINLLIGLLSEPKLTDARRQQLIHELYELLSRIDWLITTLLKISRLDAGTVQFKQEQVSLEELLKKSCVTLLIPMELRGQELRIHADGAFRGVLLCKQAAKNFHTICKKETALKRVLSNLLSAVSLLRFKAVFSCGFRVPPGSGLYQSCAAGSVCIPAGQKYCSPRPRKSCPADRKTPGLPSRCIGHRW